MMTIIYIFFQRGKKFAHFPGDIILAFKCGIHNWGYIYTNETGHNFWSYGYINLLYCYSCYFGVYKLYTQIYCRSRLMQLLLFLLFLFLLLFVLFRFLVCIVLCIFFFLLLFLLLVRLSLLHASHVFPCVCLFVKNNPCVRAILLYNHNKWQCCDTVPGQYVGKIRNYV